MFAWSGLIAMIVKSKKAQVWIETVIYTLIGLILIAIVLAYATPKIQESQDNLLVGQSIDAMQVFAEKIDETAAAGIGTRSIVSLTIKKGERRETPKRSPSCRVPRLRRPSRGRCGLPRG